MGASPSMSAAMLAALAAAFSPPPGEPRPRAASPLHGAKGRHEGTATGKRRARAKAARAARRKGRR